MQQACLWFALAESCQRLSQHALSMRLLTDQACSQVHFLPLLIIKVTVCAIATSICSILTSSGCARPSFMAAGWCMTAIIMLLA